MKSPKIWQINLKVTDTPTDYEKYMTKDEIIDMILLGKHESGTKTEVVGVQECS